MKHTYHRGFTLVETMVAIVIVAALATVGVAGHRCAKQRARSVVEVNAARNLITAYLGDAADNGGRVMPGYQEDPEAANLEGELLHFPVNARYPWRLAPSLPRIEGVMLYNGNEKALASSHRDYLVSVQPNMGLNAVLVGGHHGTGSPLAPTPRMVAAVGKFYLSQLGEADSPEKLIVFASARSGEHRGGYYEVRPPNLTGRVWSQDAFSEDTPPSAYGFVDFRWSGKAAVACLAGNVELRDEKSLRDMRRWSIQAAAENNPDFVIRPR